VKEGTTKGRLNREGDVHFGVVAWKIWNKTGFMPPSISHHQYEKQIFFLFFELSRRK
jgi:hypothetical protein